MYVCMYASNVLNKFLLADIECPEGMVYKQCGSLCPPTCDDIKGSLCSDRFICERGCFCSGGTVLYNNTCTDPESCHKPKPGR